MSPWKSSRAININDKLAMIALFFGIDYADKN